MGKAPCCDKHAVRRGAWTPEEDEALVEYINNHGHGSWRNLPKQAGLLRCGKSCRLRWINYLRPDIKRGPFTTEEENTIIQLHAMLGNRWAAIASQLPGRTDNEIKNYWNTQLKKRLPWPGHSLGSQQQQQHHSFSPNHHHHHHSVIIKSESPSTRHMAQWESARVEAEARLSMESALLNSWSNSNSTSETTTTTHPDYFLQLWHSEVGQSFRMIKGKEGEVPCQSLVSQETSSSPSPSPSSKLESCSDVSMQVKNSDTGTSSHKPKLEDVNNTVQEQASSYKPKIEEDTGGSESGYYEFLDSSDSALKHLLDMPDDGDIGFLGQTDNFMNLLDDRCD